MAIALEFIDLIIPISVIEEKYPGGWNQCLLDHAELIGGAVESPHRVVRLDC